MPPINRIIAIHEQVNISIHQINLRFKVLLFTQYGSLTHSSQCLIQNPQVQQCVDGATH